MYQDGRQWVRLAYTGFLLFMVWVLVQPNAMKLWEQWGYWTGFIQVAFFAISAGLIFPKAKKLSPEQADSDFWQFIAGLFLSGLAWAMMLF